MTSFDLGPALLFCPASRPDRYLKAAARADAVILDLEDAVAPADKAAARQAIESNPLDPTRTIVRVNGVRSGELSNDLESLAGTGYRTLMLPKAESVQDVGALSGYDVVALVETARGVVAANEIAGAEAVIGLMWGAEDLVASLGGTSSRSASGTYRDVAMHARSSVLLAAGAYGRAAIDAVHTDLADHAGLLAEAEDAAASGFTATACLHPDQVEAIRGAYRPSDEQVEWARRVVAESERRPGVFSIQGQMVDEPVLAQARRVLSRV